MAKMEKTKKKKVQYLHDSILSFIEKLSTLPGFEPGTSPVPSRYATNWAILAWIITKNLSWCQGIQMSWLVSIFSINLWCRSVLKNLLFPFFSSTFSDTSLLGEKLLALFVMRRNLTCAQVWLAILKIIGIPNVLSCVLLNLGQGAWSQPQNWSKQTNKPEVQRQE